MSFETSQIEDDFDPEWEHRLADFLQQPPVLFNLYRIAILLDLYHADSEDYSTLKRSLGLSDGHLSTHLKVLKHANLIVASKELLEDRTRTMFHITPDGMATLETLFKEMDRVKGRVQPVEIR
jgi:DNA-binding MarR family transcriptional regulator